MKDRYQTPLVRLADPVLVCGKSMTKQAFKDECDVHTIIDRFKETGQIPQAAIEGQYGDFTGVEDYHSAMTLVRQAQEMFEALPAEVRDRFKNDPGAFVEFVEDPENGQALVDMGLAVSLRPAGEHLGSEGPPAGSGEDAPVEPAEGAGGAPERGTA